MKQFHFSRCISLVTCWIQQLTCGLLTLRILRNSRLLNHQVCFSRYHCERKGFLLGDETSHHFVAIFVDASLDWQIQVTLRTSPLETLQGHVLFPKWDLINQSIGPLHLYQGSSPNLFKLKRNLTPTRLIRSNLFCPNLSCTSSSSLPAQPFSYSVDATSSRYS